MKKKNTEWKQAWSIRGYGPSKPYYRKRFNRQNRHLTRRELRKFLNGQKDADISRKPRLDGWDVI